MITVLSVVAVVLVWALVRSKHRERPVADKVTMHSLHAPPSHVRVIP